MNHKKQKKIVIGILFISIFLAAKISISMMFIFWIFGISAEIQFPVIFCYTYINIFRMFYSAQFILAASAVFSRFKALNYHLERSIPISTIKIISTTNSTFHKVDKIFHELCDAIEVINKTFTCHFVFIFAICLVGLLSFWWRLFLIFKNNSRSQ